MGVQQCTHACMFMSTSTARVAFEDSISIDNGSGSPTASGLDPSVPVCSSCRLRADQLIWQATRPGRQRKQKQSKPSFQRLAGCVSWRGWSVVGLVVTRRRVRLRLHPASASVFYTIHTPDSELRPAGCCSTFVMRPLPDPCRASALPGWRSCAVVLGESLSISRLARSEGFEVGGCRAIGR